MILAVDVQYNDETASIGAVLFEAFDGAEEPVRFHLSYPDPEPYVPGAFYRRELPCILALLENPAIKPETIIVDGHVYLDGLTKPGLGKHLYDALNGEVAVIGVAKSAFTGIDPSCEIFRGSSKKPLYVSAVGITHDAAKRNIIEMHGNNRIPSRLREADQIARHGLAAPGTKS